MPNKINEISQSNFDEEPTELKFRANVSSNHGIYRALSTVSANQSLVTNQRNLLARNFRRISINDEIVTIDHSDAEASFVLPNLYDLPDEIQHRVMNNLVDLTTLNNLEENKRLNWWVSKNLPSPKLFPLVTTGDGNCLLHATSLAMWGFHDHSLSMRKALNETLITSKPNSSLYRRWRWAQSVQNKKYGLVFSEQEWNEEWKNLLKLSSTEPRISQKSLNNDADSNRTKSPSQTSNAGSKRCSGSTTRQYYESLEEFHVYVLANNIRRAIIVYSDTVLRTNDGEPISPIEFGGIYLPLEIPPEKCHKQPVFLAFDASHFSALVPMEQNSKVNLKASYRIPLIDISATDLLPIHFFVDPGEDFSWPIDEELSDEKIHVYTRFLQSRSEILESYLNLCEEKISIDEFRPAEQTENAEIEQTPTVEILHSTNETNSTINGTNVQSKKISRSSLNSFSRILRRTFLEPFSSSKRSSFRQQSKNSNDEFVEEPSIDENEKKRRRSSPLLDHRTKMLTVILTNFQPKRPKTSDNMIKNYIDACLAEYQIEKSKGEPEERSSVRSTNSTLIKTYRTHGPTMSNRNSNENDLASRIQRQSTERKSNVVKDSKQIDLDENDDFFSSDNGQISSNVNYLQTKTRNITQSNSFDSRTIRPTYSEHPNNSNSSSFRRKVVETIASPISRPNAKQLPNSFQSVSLRRQSSLGTDRNKNSSNIPDNCSTYQTTVTISSSNAQTGRPSNNYSTGRRQ